MEDYNIRKGMNKINNYYSPFRCRKAAIIFKLEVLKTITKGVLAKRDMICPVAYN